MFLASFGPSLRSEKELRRARCKGEIFNFRAPNSPCWNRRNVSHKWWDRHHTNNNIMTINKSFLFLILIALLSCKSSVDKNTDNLNLFSKCSDKTVSDNYKEVNNSLFKIKYPDNWTEDHELPSGLDISSNNFQDTLQRGFMFSVVPYQEMYLKKNPTINYFKYINTTYNNFEAVFLTRNDLLSANSTVRFIGDQN